MRNVLRWLLAVLLLPVNFIVITPLLLFEFDFSRWSDLGKGLSLLLCVLGLMLSIRAVRVFAKRGRGGTPAPWDPINQLIIGGVFFFISPLVASISILPIPIILIIAFFFQKNLSPRYLAVRNAVGILNNTSTAIGKRLLKDRLLNPIRNVSKLNNRYNYITCVSKC